MIHNAHLWVPLLERDNVTNKYRIFTFIITIYFYLTISNINAHLTVKTSL